MNGGWRAMAHKLILQHNQHGVSLTIPGWEGDQPPDFDDSGFPVLEVKGPHLQEKQVREWLWQNRAPAKDAHLIWSLYDDGKGISRLGLGVLVQTPV